jgi:RNA polymerase sigma-70 factor (ECF subfamily)
MTAFGPQVRWPAADQTGWPDGGFAGFYRAEAVLLLRFLLVLGATVPEAVDASGRAFIEVSRRWWQLTDPRGYLRRVAAAEWEPLRGHRPTAAELELRRAWAVELIEDACCRPEIEQLLAGYDTLPADQRLMLAFSLDGYSAAEIAELLGRPLGLVESSLRRGGKVLGRHQPPRSR